MCVSQAQPPLGEDQSAELAPVLERTKKHGPIDELLPILAREPALDLVHQVYDVVRARIVW